MRKGEIRVGKVWEGKLVGTDLKIGIVVARFNQLITSQLLSGALGTLERHGVDHDAIDVSWFPEAYEIPLVAETLAQKDEYDEVITLGTVIRGATTHYDYVCNEVAKGVTQASANSKKPVIFGVLTTETIEQAIERAGTMAGNKVSDVAIAAIEMANLMKII